MNDLNKNKIAAIRRKMKAGTASDFERAQVEQWAREHPRGRPKMSKSDTQTNPETPGREGGTASASPEVTTTIPTVESTLPGMGNGTEGYIPPINVNPNSNATGAAGNTGPTNGSTQSTHTASTAGTNSNTGTANGPRMNSQEQEASAEMIALMTTKVLSGFNDYNKDKGKLALPGEFIALFHASVKRMALRYGANVNEEQFDTVVIVGSAGFVGYQSWLAYNDPEEESARKTQAENPGQQPTSKPKEKVIIDERPIDVSAAPNGTNGTVKQPIGAITRFPNPRFNPKGVF